MLRTIRKTSPFLLMLVGPLGLFSASLPTADEIGERAARADLKGTAILQDYVLTRKYEIDNPRFGKHAEMTVRMSYKAGQGKSFEIIEMRNADGMGKKIFEKLLEAEKESSLKSAPDEMRIGPQNYFLELHGVEQKNGKECYVLSMKPKRKGKLMLEGKVWISTDDYGVVYLEGRPTERVSFWVGRPTVTQSFCKVGPVWMMSVNKSIAEVKLAGRSELSIHSSDFKINTQAAEFARSGARAPRGRAANE